MAQLSVGADLAWQIAAFEAGLSEYRHLDEDHLLIGLASLEKGEALVGATLEKKARRSLELEREAISAMLRRCGLRCTHLRRTLRLAMGRGGHQHSEKVIHRSRSCKAVFAQAETLATGDEEVTSLHLVAALMGAAGDRVHRVLTLARVKATDVRREALRSLEAQRAGLNSADAQHLEPPPSDPGLESALDLDVWGASRPDVEPSENRTGAGGVWAISTHWSNLQLPREPSHPEWQERWEYFFKRYQPAMLQYVQRVLYRASPTPLATDEHMDVVDDYIVQCMKKGWLSPKEEPIRCFRAYLRTQLKCFTYDHIRKKHAARRYPGSPPQPLLDDPPRPESDPDAGLLDDAVLEIAIEEAIKKLRDVNPDYAVLVTLLFHVRFDKRANPLLRELLGVSGPTLASHRFRAMKRFRELLRRELEKLGWSEEDESCE